MGARVTDITADERSGVPSDAERVESLVSQEHAAWVSHKEEAGRRMGGEG